MSIDLDYYLQIAAQHPSMDLYLAEGRLPVLKGPHGLTALSGVEPVAYESLYPLLKIKFGALERESWERRGSCRFRIEASEIAFRIDLARESRGVIAIIRPVAHDLPNLDSLGVPEGVKSLLLKSNGLILFVGPGSSGLTTLSSSFAAALCQTRSLRARILDSDPEWILPRGQSLLIKGSPSASLSDDIQASHIAGTDLFVFGDVEPSSLNSVLEASAGGALVLANLRASSCVHALERIQGVTSLFTRVLCGIVCTHLIPNASGAGLSVAWDILINTHQVAEAINSGELQGIPQLQSVGSAEGMINLDDSLSLLQKHGKITKNEAQIRAHEPQRFE